MTAIAADRRPEEEKLRLDTMNGHPDLMPSSKAHSRAWEDWGTVNPLYAIVTDPKYRHGGDVDEFFRGGKDSVNEILSETDRLGIGRGREAALDFGCGIGRLSAGLADHFKAVTGVDVSSTMVASGRELHTNRVNLEFKQNQNNDLRWIPESSFDLVLSLLVLQHLESTRTIEGFLRDFVRILKPGGAIVVQLPSRVPAHRPPLPPSTTRAGVRLRTANLLRRVGVSARVLYERFDWVPEMTLLALSEETTRKILEDAGGTVVYVTPPSTDAGGTIHHTYFVTR
jgi:2-polyprenyl-3-methyl-5-hydroxy-6-metoxy-1,4-benzoquinol methylase